MDMGSICISDFRLPWCWRYGSGASGQDVAPCCWHSCILLKKNIPGSLSGICSSILCPPKCVGCGAHSCGPIFNRSKETNKQSENLPCWLWCSQVKARLCQRRLPHRHEGCVYLGWPARATSPREGASLHVHILNHDVHNTPMCWGAQMQCICICFALQLWYLPTGMWVRIYILSVKTVWPYCVRFCSEGFMYVFHLSFIYSFDKYGFT